MNLALQSRLRLPHSGIFAASGCNRWCDMQTIEAETGQKVCVVYGALPPEMRRIQARLFNDADTDYQVRTGRPLHLHARLGTPPPPPSQGCTLSVQRIIPLVSPKALYPSVAVTQSFVVHTTTLASPVTLNKGWQSGSNIHLV